MTSETRSGIYAIRCSATDKLYIGQSGQLQKRRAEHFCLLRKNRHGNSHLQAAWNLHGELCFSYAIIERCPVALLDSREKFWIEFFDSDSREHGFNFESGGNRNKICSAETRAKMAAARLGKTMPAATCAKISSALSGREVSAETCKRLAAAQLGKKHPSEAIARMSAAHRGKKISKEARLKLATAHYKSNTSGVHGVRFRKDTGRWAAGIKVNQKNISLGCYGTREEAAAARAAANIFYFGPQPADPIGDRT